MEVHSEVHCKGARHCCGNCLCLLYILTLQRERKKAFLSTEWCCALIWFRKVSSVSSQCDGFCFLQSGLMFLIQICYLTSYMRGTFHHLSNEEAVFASSSENKPLLIN